MRPRQLFSLLCLLLALACASRTRADDPLERGFTDPPPSARPHTWWHWINGNITQQGITADLEAMKRVGIGGAQIFNVDVGIPPGKTPFMSPQWREAVRHAAREAKRLGLELCVHNGAGWSSSGGPWITPQYAMQRLTWSETPVHGPMRFTGTLPQPPTRLGYYRDIALMAVRRPASRRAGRCASRASLPRPPLSAATGSRRTARLRRRGWRPRRMASCSFRTAPIPAETSPGTCRRATGR